jgi:hypothetical protein
LEGPNGEIFEDKVQLNTRGPLGISLIDEEMEDLFIFFLEILTDYEFISNPIF